VELYGDASLGGDRELLESCQAGTIAMVDQATSPQVSFIKEVGVFDIPGVLTDIDQTIRFLQGPFFDYMQKYYEKAGVRLLRMAPSGFRELSSNKEIRSFEDIKGLKLRTMENQYHMAFWKACGANPTPLAFGELYIALQQGLVQAQENPIEVMTASKFIEVQKYLIMTHHITFVGTTIMNLKQWNSLPAELKTLVNDTMKKATVFQNETRIAAEATVKKALIDYGREIIELKPADFAKMKEAAKVVIEMVGKNLGNEIVEKFLAEYEAAKK